MSKNESNYVSPFTRIDVPIKLGQKVIINERGPYYNHMGQVHDIRVSYDAPGILIKVVGCDEWKGSYVCPLNSVTLCERTTEKYEKSGIA